jgi:hypothetical protein
MGSTPRQFTIGKATPFFFLSSAFLATKLQLYNKSLSNVSRRSSSPDLLHKLISFQGNSTDTEIAFFKG